MDFTTHPQAGARCLRSCPKAKRIKLCSLVLDQRDGDPFRVSMYMYATWRAQLVMEERNTFRSATFFFLVNIGHFLSKKALISSVRNYKASISPASRNYKSKYADLRISIANKCCHRRRRTMPGTLTFTS